MAGELILIIEDNEKNRKLARDVLQVKGYQTIESETAEEGLKFAVEKHPALILMDIQLPGIDGITALKQLRADPITKTIPTIAITASAMTYNRVTMLAEGFDVVLVDAGLERRFHLQLGLADAGEHDLARRHARREGAGELAARDDVGTGAEPRQGRDHRLIAVGLERVADRRVDAGEGVGEAAVACLERARRIDPAGRAVRRRDLRQRHVVGVEHAVAIGEGAHRVGYRRG